MLDNIKTSRDLAIATGMARTASGKSATEIAQHAGRSRDILYRLERGDDITVSALLDLLRAMGYSLRLEPARMPTLEEMTQRFAADFDQGDGA